MTFWNIVCLSFVQIYQAFGRNYCLHLQGGCKYFFWNVANFRPGYSAL